MKAFDHNTNRMVFYAFCYCLNMGDEYSSECSFYLIQNWEHLNSVTQEYICAQITQTLKSNRRRDRDHWQAVLDYANTTGEPR